MASSESAEWPEENSRESKEENREGEDGKRDTHRSDSRIRRETQRRGIRGGDLPRGQSGTEEYGRRSSGDGAAGRALTYEFGGGFQNHALNGHTQTYTRKIMIPGTEETSKAGRDGDFP
jgi:hypothetical protein